MPRLLRMRDAIERAGPAMRGSLLFLSGGLAVLVSDTMGVAPGIQMAAIAAVLALSIGLCEQCLARQESRIAHGELRLLALERELVAQRQSAPVLAAETAAAPVEQDRTGGVPAGARFSRIGDRPCVVFSDGTIILHTMFGYRYFASEADARFFVGSSWERGEPLAG